MKKLLTLIMMSICFYAFPNEEIYDSETNVEKKNFIFRRDEERKRDIYSTKFCFLSANNVDLEARIIIDDFSVNLGKKYSYVLYTTVRGDYWYKIKKMTLYNRSSDIEMTFQKSLKIMYDGSFGEEFLYQFSDQEFEKLYNLLSEIYNKGEELRAKLEGIHLQRDIIIRNYKCLHNIYQSVIFYRKIKKTI